jgi:hypothetical protein
MLQDCSGRAGKAPDEVTSHEVFARAHGIGLSGREPSAPTTAGGTVPVPAGTGHGACAGEVSGAESPVKQGMAFAAVLAVVGAIGIAERRRARLDH